MFISNYQMHNVLKVYTNQLSKRSSIKKDHDSPEITNSESIRISADGKRRNIIDQVAADIVNRITKRDLKKKSEPEIIHRLQEEINEKSKHEHAAEIKLVYNVIHDGEKKTQNTFSIEDLHSLMDQLEKLAMEPVDNA